MVDPKKFICFHCKHFRPFKGGCDAFPDGIPYEIAELGQPHNKPLKGQKNKIVFERGIPERVKGTAWEKKFKALLND